MKSLDGGNLDMVAYAISAGGRSHCRVVDEG